MARKRRLYSLFEKQVDGTWKRLTERAYNLDTAIHVFQNRLLAPFLGYEDNVRGERMLKPVRN